MRARANDILDLSFLSITKEESDDYIIGNGKNYLNVPEIGIEVIKLCDGSRTIKDIEEILYKDKKIEVDVIDFISTLSDMGILEEVNIKKNIFDKIEPKHVNWLFSIPLKVIFITLIIFTAFVLYQHPLFFPNYNSIMWTTSPTVSTLTFFISTWILVYIHEISHVLAARSLNIPASISLGTRLQFLVVQTEVSNAWVLHKNKRYRVYLAGLFSDLFLFCLGESSLYFIDRNAISYFIKMLLLIKVAQIIWQFLFFMKTDIYYTLANFWGEKNLLADSLDYIKNRRKERSSILNTNKHVKIYGWFIVFGRLISFLFLIIYTVPISFTIIKKSVTNIFDLDSVIALIIMLFSWSLFFYILIKNKRKEIHIK